METMTILAMVLLVVKWVVGLLIVHVTLAWVFFFWITSGFVMEPCNNYRGLQGMKLLFKEIRNGRDGYDWGTMLLIIFIVNPAYVALVATVGLYIFIHSGLMGKKPGFDNKNE